MTITSSELYEIYEMPGSPCLKCIVRSTCTRDFMKGSICKDFIDFILDDVERCAREGKNRLYNK